MRALPDHHPATLQRLARKLFDAVCKTHRDLPTTASLVILSEASEAVFKAHHLFAGDPRSRFVEVAELLNSTVACFNESLAARGSLPFRFEQ